MNDDTPTERVDPDDTPTARTLRPGARVFGRYTLEVVAGRGGMGVVWRAHDATLSEAVALKFLPEVVARDAVAIDELKAETRRTRRLRHPHIVSVHDFIQDEQHAAVSMEFVDGVTLAQLRLVQPGKVFAPETLAPLVAQLCGALDYAHASAKVVHRDLKPANILVTREGEAKISDFGIARSLTETHTRLTGTVAGTSGTLLYMSPQQLKGKKTAPADDIYALGATLYELLTGKPPFYTGDITHQVLSEKPAGLTAQRAELGNEGAPIPRRWEETILACLAKDPAQRPQTVGEVAARLALSGAPVALPSPAAVSAQAKLRDADDYATKIIPPPERSAGAPAKDRKRKSQTSLFAALAATVLLGLGAWYYFGVVTPESEKARRAEATRQAAEVAALAHAAEKPVADERAQRDEAPKFAELGRASARAGRMGEAIGYFEEALKIKPDDAQSHNELGILLAQSGRSSEAIAHFEAALRLKPDYDDARANLAQLQNEKEGSAGGRTASASAGTQSKETTRAAVVPEKESSPAVDTATSGSGGDVARIIQVTHDRNEQVQLAAERGFSAALAKSPGEEEKPPKAVANTGPVAGQPWENTLGMKFVPVPGTDVLFSIWDTRVQDFEAFVQETDHDATAGMYSLSKGRWIQNDYTWKSPGFAQGPTHPVVVMKDEDAKAFCSWLTKKERDAGRLTPNQAYRLPTNGEWRKAVGPGEFPWGDQWPPPRGAGNYAGSEASDADWNSDWPTIEGYSDGYPRTSPVGSFAANRYGLFDMGGNVWQRMEDGGLRGASFYDADRRFLASSFHKSAFDLSFIGFRVVVSVGSAL